MSAVATAQPLKQIDSQPKLQVNPRIVMSFYLLIPIFFAIVGLDHFVFNQRLLPSGTVQFDKVFWFTIFFVHPHVYVSFFGFLEKEYWQHYKIKFLTMIPLILAFAFFGSRILGVQNYLALGAIWAAKHLSGQQLGITTLITQNRSKNNTYWEWAGIFLSIMVYYHLAPDEMFFLSKNTADLLFVVASVPFLYLSSNLWKESKTQEGRYFILCNIGLIFSGFLFTYLKYPMFAYLIIRIIHELTGSYFYGVHDENRFKFKSQNILYKALAFTRLPVFWQCQIFAILLVLPLNFIGNPTVEVLFATFPTWCHYYFDSIAWKRGGPHRFYVPLRS